MNREEVAAALRAFKHAHAKDYGILEMGVFGSIARDEAGPSSDVDICVKTITPNPFALVHIQEALQALLHAQVDIVRIRDTMNPFLKQRIEEEAFYV